MTREEELEGLKALCDTLANIPEEERFDYFFNNSPTFRKDVLKLGLQNIQISTFSDFKLNECAFSCAEYSIPEGISSFSIEKETIFSRLEEVAEDSEWKMITEAA